jgi:hypothetical protein
VLTASIGDAPWLRTNALRKQARRLAGVPAEALAGFPPAWIGACGAGGTGCRSAPPVAPAIAEATADTERTASLPEPPPNVPSSGCAGMPYARSAPPRGRAARSARGISAGVDRARAGGFWLVARPWSIQSSPKQLPTRNAPAACPNRRGTRPHLPPHEHLTPAARRPAGVPPEALAQFPPAWIERGRAGEFYVQ